MAPRRLAAQKSSVLDYLEYGDKASSALFPQILQKKKDKQIKLTKEMLFGQGFKDGRPRRVGIKESAKREGMGQRSEQEA